MPLKMSIEKSPVWFLGASLSRLGSKVDRPDKLVHLVL